MLTVVWKVIEVVIIIGEREDCLTFSVVCGALKGNKKMKKKGKKDKSKRDTERGKDGEREREIERLKTKNKEKD